MQSRRRWPWVLLGLIAGSPALVAGVMAVGYRWSIARTAATLPEELAIAKHAGAILDVSEIQRLASGGTGENAAADYRKILADMGRSSRGLSADQLMKGGYKPKQFTQLLQCLSDWQSDLDLLYKVADKPRLDWGRNWDMPRPDGTDDSWRLSELGELLSCRATIRALNGNTEGALGDIGTYFKLANQIGMEPTFDAFSRRCSYESNAMEDLHFALNRPASLAQIDQALGLVRDLKPLPDIRKEFAVEITLTLRSIDADAADWDSSVADDERSLFSNRFTRGSTSDALFRNKTFYKARKARLLHYLNRSLVRMSGVGPTLRQLKSAGDALCEDMENDRSEINSENPSPALGYAVSSAIRNLADRRILLQALTILRILASGQNIPAKLPLDGPDGIDPFTGGHLGYRADAESFRVYSVGEDLVDDHGITVHESRRRPTHDLAVIFKLNRSPARSLPAK